MKLTSKALLLACALIAVQATAYDKEIKSVLEFYHKYPEQKNCKLLQQIFDEVKPRSTLARVWRFVIGKAIFLPRDFERHYLLMSAQDIGKELGWDKEKIDQEFEALCAECDYIRKGIPATKKNLILKKQ